ncbi:MAG: Omp28-related outer membrane protein [Prevotella sp.]
MIEFVSKKLFSFNSYVTFVLSAAALLSTLPAFADGNGYEVTTEPTRKGFLLEEFTGIHCGYCPQGHIIANRLTKSPAEVYVIAVHAGYYAVPNSDEPDYRVDEGVAVNDTFGVNSYPSGMVNRHKYEEASNAVTGRSMWTYIIKNYYEETAPLNLLVKSEYNGSTRKLDVTVEGYFTAEGETDSLMLNVAWTQDDIVGPQNGANMGSEYVHKHMLRGYVTPIWGDTLGTVRHGEYFSRRYSITIPESIKDIDTKPEDMNVVAFVTRNKGDVQQVAACKPAYTDFTRPLAVTLSAPKIPIDAVYGYNFFEMVLKNNSNSELTSATVAVNINGTTQNCEWQGSIAPFEEQEITVNCKYALEPVSYNTYKICVTALNGTAVESNALEGQFSAPAAASPTVAFSLKTNKEAADNRFLIRDADGNIVKEFGPFDNGEINEYADTLLLEAQKTYCFEVTDAWGDGIYSPRGSFESRSSDRSIIEQVFDIPNFGTRSFFCTSKEDSGIKKAATDASRHNVAIFSMDGRCIYEGVRSGFNLPEGIFIVYDKESRTVTKELNR